MGVNATAGKALTLPQDGRTALMVAVRDDVVEIATWLLDRGAAVEARDNVGFSAAVANRCGLCLQAQSTQRESAQHARAVCSIACVRSLPSSSSVEGGGLIRQPADSDVRHA